VIEGKDPFNQFGLFKGKSIAWENYKRDSVNSEFPYAIIRSWQGLTLNVKEPASVLVNPELGYVFAGTNMKIVTTVTGGLRTTHGSLYREESLGIFASTDRELPPISAEEFNSIIHLK
jgi:hypothetical protein